MTKFEKSLEGAGYLLGAIAAAWVAYRFKKGIDYRDGKGTGVGAVRQKRRIYQEMADLQATGIFTGAKWDNLSIDEKEVVRREATRHNFSGSPRSTKSVPEQYYNSIVRAYNAISGTDISPIRTSTVYNELGDPIIIYNDYGTPGQKFQRAAEYWEDTYNDPYHMAILYIADGTKLVWSAKKPKYGVKEHAFATGTGANEERKKRISYLSKDGITPDMLAHRMWEYYGTDNTKYTSQDCLDGVVEAIQSIENVSQARDMIWRAYIDAHTAEEDVNTYESPDLPF